MAWKKSHSRPRRRRARSPSFFAAPKIIWENEYNGHEVEIKQIGNGYVGYIDGIPRKTVHRADNIDELKVDLAYAAST